MKKGNLIAGIIGLLTGIALLILCSFKSDSLLFGFGCGFMFAGIADICRYIYWNAPDNRERYQEKLENERIELHDELKEKLRDKSGRYAYVLGLATVSSSIIIFAILGHLEMIHNSRLIVLYLGGYLAFQIVAGIVIFKHLLKKY